MQPEYKFTKIVISSLISIFCTISAVYAQGIIKPDAKPSVFAPGIISTPDGEFAPTFTADGKTVYFTGDPTYIYSSKLINNTWTKPTITSFSGRWKDMDPFLSPDGKRLFFSSYRPLQGDTQLKFAHIWYVDRVGKDAWSAPHHLDAPVNIDGINNYAPAVSGSGTLFFFSPNRDVSNRSSYYCKWLGDRYDSPKLVAVNGDGGVHDPYISANERFLVFASGGSLYISFRQGDHWADRQKLEAQVNDGSKNSSPCVSPDGKTLYYSSSRENGILMIPVNLPKG